MSDKNTSINLHIVNAPGHLLPYIKLIKGEFRKTIFSVNQKLRISNIDILVYSDADHTIPELGIGGYTANAHLIYIPLSPDFPNLRKTIEREFGRVLTHELHHCMRWKNPGYGQTLLEAIVSEGLADHFEIEINGKLPEPWCRALNDEQVKKFFAKAKLEFDNKHYNFRDWFLGSKRRGIPRWTGYTLGFQMIKDYLEKNPRKKASELYETRAKLFIGG